MTQATTDEFDSPWKDIIEWYFPNFLEQAVVVESLTEFKRLVTENT